MSTPSPRHVVETALHELLEQRDLTAIDRWWDPGYIQHNAMMPDGSAVIRQMVLGAPGFASKTVRTIAEGDLVVVHNRVTGVGPTNLIGFEIFRVAGGKLVEHWDVQQPEQLETVSGHSQIDGPTEIVDRDKTAANKQLVMRFFDDVLYHHKMDRLTAYISPTSYIQHNPGVGDGLAGFGKAMADLAKAGLTMEYQKTYRYIAEGNFVFTHSEGIFAGKHVAFADLFRIEDGLIVEHWDCIREVETTRKNPNSTF
ncbi:MAG: nuclear transport factor 2 family protein [Deltaproteobacteria bacterium]|nr:nuclear transport factor 2 family protein [Deltaproteobacteria bacterium]